MCELFAMSSRKPATVVFSLEEFARHGGPATPRKDGWGIAYLQERDVWVIKESVPAGSSALVRFIESHELRSTLVMSHIRQAKRGAVCFENTQPYRRKLGGRAHVFAHNGDLVDIQASGDLCLGRRRPMGATDSDDRRRLSSYGGRGGHATASLGGQQAPSKKIDDCRGRCNNVRRCGQVAI